MSDLGALALRFALPVALLGIVAGVFAGVKRRDDWTQGAERAIWIVGLFVAIAMVSLAVAFANCDFELRYVANNSSRDMALPYRLAAVWGGQAGSLLLWLFIMMIYACACVAFQGRQNRTLMPWVSVVLLANATFFLVLLTFVTEPFEKLPPSHVVSDGAGLNPLLQHPVMMIHPIMLYTGLVGFVVPFAFAFAALATGELGTHWFRTTRRWTLFPLLFLSIGIMLGGRWAYEVLGWGGYWAWDPVENASFMPWLVGTALIHSLAVTERRGLFKSWTLLLAISAFSLSLLGTFLVRSGILVSVHAFASDPTRGYFILIFLAIVVIGALILYAWCAPKMDSAAGFGLLSRETFLLLNNVLLVVAATLILLGTLAPLIVEMLNGGKISIGAPWFEIAFLVPMIPLIFLLGLGMHTAWRQQNKSPWQRLLRMPAIAAVIVGVV